MKPNTQALPVPDPPQRRRFQRKPLPQDSALRLREVVNEQVEIKGYLGTSGKVRMDARSLYRALGPVTWRVYSSLLTFRDETGDTRVTTSSLAVASQTSEAGVKRALVRLRDAALIEDLGWMYLSVPCSCPKWQGPHLHEVYVRRVYGQLAAAENGTRLVWAWVPVRAAAWLIKSAGLGGRRVNAGRKGAGDAQEQEANTPVSKALQKSDRTPYKYLSSFSSDVLSEHQEKPRRCGCVSLFVKEPEEKPSRGHNHLPSYTAKKCRKRHCSLHDQPKRVSAALDAFLGSSSGGAAPAAASQVVHSINQARHDQRERLADAAQSAGKATATPAKARSRMRMGMDTAKVTIEAQEAPAAFLPSDESVREWTMGGGAQRRRQHLSVEDLQAMTGLLREIKVARVPAPPKLSASMDEAQKLRLMQAAYKAAHEKVMGSEFYSRKPLTAKEREAMAAAADVLIEHDISPTAWARFSFHAWLEKMRNDRAPAAAWLWNAERIVKHRGWCRDATGTQHSNLPLAGPAYRALIRAYGRLTQELGHGRSTADVVESVLPADKRKELLAALQNQNARAIKEVSERIQAGEWVW